MLTEMKGRRAMNTLTLLNLSLIIKAHILPHWHEEHCRQAELAVWLCHSVCATSPSVFHFIQLANLQHPDSWRKKSGFDSTFVPTDTSSCYDMYRFLIIDFQFLVLCLTWLTRRSVLVTLGYLPLQAHCGIITFTSVRVYWWACVHWNLKWSGIFFYHHICW